MTQLPWQDLKARTLGAKPSMVRKSEALFEGLKGVGVDR